MEINHTIAKLTGWIKPRRLPGTLLMPLCSQRLLFEAKGRVLIMAPGNAPFLLLMSPILSAIAAGNCVIAKPSAKNVNQGQSCVAPDYALVPASLVDSFADAYEKAVWGLYGESEEERRQSPPLRADDRRKGLRQGQGPDRGQRRDGRLGSGREPLRRGRPRRTGEGSSAGGSRRSRPCWG